MVLALQCHYCLTIYTDCSALISACNHLILARLTGSQPQFGDHEDLWAMVWELILTRPADCLKLCKVKAHQNISTIEDPHLRWLATMNHHVDLKAKALVKQFTAGCTRQLQRFESDIKRNRLMLQQFFTMWGCMNELAMQIIKTKKTTPRSGAMPEFAVEVDFHNLTTLQCEVADSHINACLYGDTFMRRVLQYFHDLEWDFSQPAVSLLELYADFSHHRHAGAGIADTCQSGSACGTEGLST